MARKQYQLATFKLNPEDWKAFKERAEAQGTNASAVLKSLVSDYLEGKLDGGQDSSGAGVQDAIAQLSQQVAALDARLGK